MMTHKTRRISQQKIVMIIFFFFIVAQSLTRKNVLQENNSREVFMQQFATGTHFHLYALCLF